MSRIACGMAVAALLAAGLPAGAAAKDTVLEIQVAEQLDAAINAGKAFEAAALFADDATVKEPGGKTLTGKVQIEAWLQLITAEAWHVDSGNLQLSDGGRVTWTASVVYASAKQLGVTPLDAFVEAVVLGGKIRSLVVRFSSAAQLRLTQARAKADEALARSLVDEVLTKGDLGRADAILSSDFANHDPMAVKATAALGFKTTVTSMRTAFPDLAYAIEEVFVSGDRVVIRGTCSGTQRGAYMGSPASGRPFKAEFIEILRVADGKVAERWSQRDSYTMLQQLGFGIAPPPPPAPAVSATATGQPVEKKKGWF